MPQFNPYISTIVSLNVVLAGTSYTGRAEEAEEAEEAEVKGRIEAEVAEEAA
jgi:hypothetical protein